jgi:Ca-activated chloride channel family protein
MRVGLAPQLLFALSVAIVVLPGRSALVAQNVPFKSGVELVPLTVTVTDNAGNYIKDLAGNDFAVFENGIQQSLSFFAMDNVPVDVALVLDTSGSMKQDLTLVQMAAVGLVHALRRGDRGAVVEVKQFASVPQPLTDDLTKVEAAIQSLSPSGATALYDTLYVVLKEFDRQRRATTDVRRQVLVLLSDGLDNRSHITFEDVTDLARRGNVGIYAIALRGDVPRQPRFDLDQQTLNAEYTMGAVSRDSGGRSFFPKSSRELPGVYGAIARELANQYELGYSPLKPGGDGAFRRVLVNVARTNVIARTRDGYYSH